METKYYFQNPQEFLPKSFQPELELKPEIELKKERKKFLPFKEAKELVKGKFENIKDYLKNYRKHPGLRSNPNVFYKKKGLWNGWNDYLGTERKEKIFSPNALLLKKQKIKIRTWIRTLSNEELEKDFEKLYKQAQKEIQEKFNFSFTEEEYSPLAFKNILTRTRKIRKHSYKLPEGFQFQ